MYTCQELKQASKALKQGLSFNSRRGLPGSRVTFTAVSIRNADLYFNLGVLYAEKEKWDQAKADLIRALVSKVSPNFVRSTTSSRFILIQDTRMPTTTWASFTGRHCLQM